MSVTNIKPLEIVDKCRLQAGAHLVTGVTYGVGLDSVAAQIAYEWAVHGALILEGFFGGDFAEIEASHG